MRISVIPIVAWALVLAGCASAPAPDRTAPAAPIVANAPTGPTPAMLLAAYLSDEAHGGRTLAEVERVLGLADLARRDGAGAALTYRFEGCALLMVFAADAQNVMRLRARYPGPRRGGEAAPDLEQCAAAALARGAPGVS